ncbi:MAG: substrate-binding domain-containing protein [Rhodospirillales bacterium]|nr:substrate-binding domain-containing protein [Rhodospirillales bacterium]
MIRLSRRHALAAPALGLLAVAAAPAPARADMTTDLVLATDPALAPALRAAAAAYRRQSGVRVHVFATPPQLILPQLQRTVQNDLVFTGLPVLSALQAAGLLAGAPGPAWSNPLVLAGARVVPITATTRLARPDASDGSAIDGAAVLAAIGLGGNPAIGAIDTPGVAWLLHQGAASAGLVHASLLGGLHRLRPVPVSASGPVQVAVALTRLARRPHPERFLAFLAGPDGRASLRHAGLQESAA